MQEEGEKKKKTRFVSSNLGFCHVPPRMGFSCPHRRGLCDRTRTFSMLYFANACEAQSTASCCMLSDMSAFLITAFLCSVIITAKTRQDKTREGKCRRGKTMEPNDGTELCCFDRLRRARLASGVRSGLSPVRSVLRSLALSLSLSVGLHQRAARNGKELPQIFR